VSTTSATNRELLGQIREIALAAVARGERVPSGARLAAQIGNDRDRVQHYLSYLRQRGEIPKVRDGNGKKVAASPDAAPPADPLTAIRQRISEIHVALGAQENLRAELARLEAALAALES